jgi:putative peptide zinc metalloprotease protein
MTTQTTAAAAHVPSTQRPIPLQQRDDLRVERIEYQGVGSWVIKDPVGLKYHRLQPEQYCVLGLLNGSRNLEEIRDELKLQFPTLSFRLVDVQHLITDLHQKGLVFSKRYGQGAALIRLHKKARKKKMLQTIKNLLYVRLPGWDPEPTLVWMYPLVRWMFRPWAVAAAVLFVLSSLVLLAVQFDTFRGKLPEFQQFFGWPNMIYLWFTLGVAKIIHEFGHGLSCKHFGGECHEMGLMLLVFSPCLYCDVSDSWMLRNKWQRIAIGGAGMYIEVILSAIAIYVWWNTQPGLLHHLALNIFFVTTVTTVIFNANPLMRFDGYYMLSDLLEIPNLRPKADKHMRESFAWYCLGIESRPDPFMPETGRAWFVVFAVAAALYRWLILFGILLFLYTVLKPYELQSLGITLAVVSFTSIFLNLFVNVYRIIAAPRIDPLNYTKTTITLAVVLFLIVGGLTIPLPRHVESACLAEPRDVRHVRTITPGRLQEVFVKPGQAVTEGELLATLENIEKEDEVRALEIEEKVQQIEIRTSHALDDPIQRQLAQQKLESIQEKLSELKRQIEHLRVTAPVDGVVVAPPRVAETKLDEAASRLDSWFGSPLEPKNLGCSLEANTHLLSIAPSEEFEVIALVDQENLKHLALDDPTKDDTAFEVMFDHMPFDVCHGTLEQIADRALIVAPPALSNKYGGELPTVTDQEGQERLVNSVYQVTVLLNDEDRRVFENLKPGMRGRARFLVSRLTAGQWIWRAIRLTFHFRL